MKSLKFASIFVALFYIQCYADEWMNQTLIDITSTNNKLQEWITIYKSELENLKTEYLQSSNFNLATNDIDMQKRIEEILPDIFFKCYFDGRFNAHQVVDEINMKIIKCYYQLEIERMIKTHVSHVYKQILDLLFNPATDCKEISPNDQQNCNLYKSNLIQKYYVKYNNSINEYIYDPLNLKKHFDSCINKFLDDNNIDKLKNLSSNIINNCFQSNITINDKNNQSNFDDVEQKINTANKILEYSITDKNNIYNLIDYYLSNVRKKVMTIENKVPTDKTNTLTERFDTHVNLMIELEKDHYNTEENIGLCEIDCLIEWRYEFSRSKAIKETLQVISSHNNTSNFINQKNLYSKLYIKYGEEYEKQVDRLQIKTSKIEKKIEQCLDDAVKKIKYFNEKK